MKKILTLLCAVAMFGGLTLQAAPVSPSRALDVARKVFAAQPATKAAAGEVKILWDGEDIATKSVQPAFYVITREGGGFVIVAGDDNVQPVLALSDHNDFRVEGMPENVRWWMDRMKSYVRSAQYQAPGVSLQWAKYMDTKSGQISGTVNVKVEKLTPEWNQGNTDNYLFERQVFNAKCPTDGVHYTLTGCVATALGELFTTLSGIYPSVTIEGTGSVGGYTPSSGCLAPDAYDLGTVYDWPGLRTLTGTAEIIAAISAGNTTLLDNLAQLLADLGAAMEASYSSTSTGAATIYIPIFMAQHFGMSKTAYYEYADDYSPRKWIAKLKAELDQRPIIYNGRTSSSGHAFIFDGYGTYEGTDVFHVNFGWSGSNNGYYYFDNLDAGGTHQYTKNCGAIFDFYPDPTSVYVKKLGTYAPGLQYLYPNSSDELVPVPSFGDGGTQFTLKGGMINFGLSSYTGSVKPVLMDKTGAIKDDTSLALDINDLPVRSGWSWYEFDAANFSGAAFALGDYVQLCYTTDDAQQSYSPIFINAAPGDAVSALPVFPMPFIKTNASYSKNDWFELALMNHDVPYSGTVWTITDPDGTTFTKAQTDYEFQLTKTGIYKIVAAIATTVGGDVIETVVAHIEVK